MPSSLVKRDCSCLTFFHSHAWKRRLYLLPALPYPRHSNPRQLDGELASPSLHPAPGLLVPVLHWPCFVLIQNPPAGAQTHRQALTNHNSVCACLHTPWALPPAHAPAQVPELKPFLDMTRKTPADRATKQQAAFTDTMRAAVEAYYFHHYAVHFAQPIIAVRRGGPGRGLGCPGGP